MFMRLQGLLLFISVLAVFAAPERSEARRNSTAPLRLGETQLIDTPHLAKSAATLDSPSGPLKISSAALEPVNWSDLDGWAGDDHA